MEAVDVPEMGRASILTLRAKQILDRNLRDLRKTRAHAQQDPHAAGPRPADDHDAVL